jgi:hypothetical protein
MTKKDRALAVLKRMASMVNDGHVITLSRDMGGFSLTVSVDGQHFHTFCGKRTEEELIEQLYSGLKWPIYDRDAEPGID